MMKRFMLVLLMGAFLTACSPAPQPTPTPIPPTSTPASVIVIAGNGVAITVPDTYIGGSEEDMTLILQTLKDMGGNFEQAAQVIEENPDMYLLFGYDTQPASSGSLTNFNVTTLQISSDVTLESQVPSLTDYYEQIGGTDIESGTCTYGELDCYEVYVTITAQGKTIRMVQYLIKEGVDVYAVTFGTDVADFPAHMPEFSQAFSTFQILR
jgi:hypothetical protein